MMTKKTMTILSVFMIVALTAVGFAAWLIVGTIEGETQGSFVSNELKDKYFKVEVNFDNDGTEADDKGKLIFGRPSAAYVNTNNAWLSYSNKDATEKLTAKATVKFIPDAGFSTNNSDPNLDRDMKYFLEEVIEAADGTVEKTQYRTVRVVIDIAEALDSDAKWVDMAVQLGYIQYPTAFVIEKDSEGNAVKKGDQFADPQTIDNVDEDFKLKWVKNDATTAESALVDYGTENFTMLKDGCLAIDLTYDMFHIDTDQKFATADIQIDFKWGEAVNKLNPYTFFKDVQPETTTIVDYYLKASGSPVTYALAETTKDIDTTTEINEGDQGVDQDSVIRYKDLAQRMLDYLRDNLDYTHDSDGNRVTGVQFSITLVEGVAIS